MSNMDEVISKSLDEIDALVEEINKVEDTQELSKALGDEGKEDVAPDEVSEDAPQEDSPEEEPSEEQGEPEVGEDDSDVDADNEGEEDEEEEEEFERSLEEELNSKDSVHKALEVSEFLNELTKGISTVLGKHTEGISKSIQSQESSNELLAKSLQGIVKSQKAVLETQTRLSKSIQTLADRVNQLESTPQVRKSVPTAKPVEKSFKASLGESPAKSDTFNKSMALAKLSDAVQKGESQYVQDILALESTNDTNVLSPAARNLLNLG